MDGSRAGSASPPGPERESSAGDGGEVEGRVLPLNSRRLTAAFLRMIAQAMALPTNVPPDQLRQLIEGKLIAMGKEPRNVQVLVTEGETGEERPDLMDGDGVFVRGAAVQGRDAPAPTDGDRERSGEEGGSSEASGEELRRLLREATRENERLREELAAQREEKAGLAEELDTQTHRADALQRDLEAAKSSGRVGELAGELEKEREKVRSARSAWRLSCEQLARYDSELAEKEEEIASLRAQLEGEGMRKESGGSGTARLRGCTLSSESLPLDRRGGVGFTGGLGAEDGDVAGQYGGRRGKAPPVDPFTGENPELHVDDWLPSLERAARWNGWTDQELLLQLAGHLRGRALLEWNLLDATEKSLYPTATEALRARLDTGGRALAAQDFRHTFQRDDELVGDFIRRLERTVQLAYGRDRISSETRATLLHSQLQEGLRYEILQTPTVSGAHTYGELCLSAKNEEKRQVELQRRERYRREAPVPPDPMPGGQRPGPAPRLPRITDATYPPSNTSPEGRMGKRCYTCGSLEHLARNCPRGKGESRGRHGGQDRNPPARTNVVHVDDSGSPVVTAYDDPRDYLFSSGSEEEGGVRRVQVSDGGSHSQSVVLEIENVPVEGLVDTGSDITIIGGELFRQVATAARLQKKRFKPPDKSPRTYSNQMFRLDGKMDLKLSFGEKDMVTPVYVKLDAPDPLLLSEGVCRQLEIVRYHQDVRPHQAGSKKLLRRPLRGAEAMVPWRDTRPMSTTCGVRSACVPPGGPCEGSAPGPMSSGTVAMETDPGTETTQMAGVNVSPVGCSLTRAGPQSEAVQSGQDVDTLEDSITAEESEASGAGVTEAPGARRTNASSVSDVDDSGQSVPTVPDSADENIPEGEGTQGQDNSHPPPSQPCSLEPVRVKLISSVKVPPNQCAIVGVRARDMVGTAVLEPLPGKLSSLEIGESLLGFSEGGTARLVLGNPSCFTRVVREGTVVGTVMGAEVLGPESLFDGVGHGVMEVGDGQLRDSADSALFPPGVDDSAAAKRVVEDQAQSTERVKWRRERLVATLDLGDRPWPEGLTELSEMLQEHHEVFVLEEDERGETDLAQLSIETGNTPPIRQPPRRIPFAARPEVSKHLSTMLRTGVIQPSQSPWASPVVLVRKKDGSLRFCIDYRPLNSVTTPDLFPLPRIDDLLDQLGRSKFFSTLDLAAGYWQVKVEPGSREKTAFITSSGLYEFRVMPFGLKNAPAVFQRLMQQVLAGLNPVEGLDFVVVYLDDVLVFSETLQDHMSHLRAVLGRVTEAGLKLKPEKCHFVRQEVNYLGHVSTPEGLLPNPKLVDAVKDFAVPTNLPEIQQFLGLASYYRRFVPKFAQIARPLCLLTRKGVPFEWTADCQASFDHLRSLLVQAPVLAYPNFSLDFTIETDASIKGLGAVLCQRQEDGRLHPVSYASRALSKAEERYAITELETLAVVWAISHYHHLIYGHRVTVVTDHSAVKAVLGTSSPSAKHARWWDKVYGCGAKSIEIVYRPGRENSSADALSRSPHLPAPDEGIGEGEVQVGVIRSEATISELLTGDVGEVLQTPDDFAHEQGRDPHLRDLMCYLTDGTLPDEEAVAQRLMAQAPQFTVSEGTLYLLDTRQKDGLRVVVPDHLREDLLREYHGGKMAGHFSGPRLYKALAHRWWWQGMYSDCLRHAKSCPQCVVVGGTVRVRKPPLQPIPVDRLFQIVGVDVMELPVTARGNRYVVVFQDFLSKFPLVFAVPNQKSLRLTRLLVEEVVPLVGVPEALLSDRGRNLLSHLMLEVCSLLGVKKLNTTAYHPQCDGMVERFNRTLKSMLRKHAAKHGAQWDTYLHAVLWAYRNTPHESTGEKPSFLLYGHDCHSPTEAALLPPGGMEPVEVEDYREEMVLALSEGRALAVRSIRKAQQRYKRQYDKKAVPSNVRVGDWVFVYFPQQETGKMRKLSRPWFGPFRVCSRDGPDVTVTRVYRPSEPIQIHLTRVVPCPPCLPAGFYWYGSKCRSPDNPPKWVDALLCADQPQLPPANGLTGGESCQGSSGATDTSGLETYGTRQDEGPGVGDADDPKGVGDVGPPELAAQGEMAEDSTPCRDEVVDLERVAERSDYCVEDTDGRETPNQDTEDPSEVVTGGSSETSHTVTHSNGCPRRRVSRWLPPGGRKHYPLRSRQKRARGRASPGGG